jgi:hypothetical protein
MINERPKQCIMFYTLYYIYILFLMLLDDGSRQVGSKEEKVRINIWKRRPAFDRDPCSMGARILILFCTVVLYR